MFDSEYFNKPTRNGSVCRCVSTETAEEVRKPKYTPCSGNRLTVQGHQNSAAREVDMPA